MPNAPLFTPRPEYPRPQFVRSEWLNLNGPWEFAFDDSDAGLVSGWGTRESPLGGDILVPFPFQARLSGIGARERHDVLWYAREFEVSEHWGDGDVFLRFGAVDTLSTVWLNGCRLGTNRGGHVPFSFNTSPFLRPGKNRLVVRVVAGTDGPTARMPRGNEGQVLTRNSGIWQTVWLEPVPARRIENVRITPDVDSDSVRLQISVTRPSPDLRLTARVSRLGYRVAGATIGGPGGIVHLEMDLGKVDLWSPERPNLYDLELTLSDSNGSDGSAIDSVRSYFGMRKLSVDGGQVLLNNRPYYHKLVLDHGFYPDGLLSAPGDDALREDVEWARKFGFNGVRKHQKVEDPRFLHWCDRLGLLVWGEMGRAHEYSRERESDLLSEWERVIRRDYNHPCLAAWAPLISEGDARSGSEAEEFEAFGRRMASLTRSADPTRLVVDHQGLLSPEGTERCLSGARFVPVGGGSSEPDCPHEIGERQRALLDRYRTAMSDLVQGDPSAGFCYQQLTDVGQNGDGLLTGYRQPKLDPRAVAAVNRRLGSS